MVKVEHETNAHYVGTTTALNDMNNKIVVIEHHTDPNTKHKGKSQSAQLSTPTTKGKPVCKSTTLTKNSGCDHAKPSTSTRK